MIEQMIDSYSQDIPAQGGSDGYWNVNVNGCGMQTGLQTGDWSLLGPRIYFYQPRTAPMDFADY